MVVRVDRFNEQTGEQEVDLAMLGQLEDPFVTGDFGEIIGTSLGAVVVRYSPDLRIELVPWPDMSGTPSTLVDLADVGERPSVFIRADQTGRRVAFSVTRFDSGGGAVSNVGVIDIEAGAPIGQSPSLDTADLVGWTDLGPVVSSYPASADLPSFLELALPDLRPEPLPDGEWWPQVIDGRSGLWVDGASLKRIDLDTGKIDVLTELPTQSAYIAAVLADGPQVSFEPSAEPSETPVATTPPMVLTTVVAAPEATATPNGTDLGGLAAGAGALVVIAAGVGAALGLRKRSARH